MKRLLAPFAALLGLLAAPSAFADQRPGCLPTDPGTVTWTLPTTPAGPSWSLTASGLDPTNPSAEFTNPGLLTATLWRRPCSSMDSQIILTVASVSGAPLIGQFALFQNGAAASTDWMTVNDPAVYGGNTFILFGHAAGTAISGVLDVTTSAPATFSPNEAFVLSYAATWPYNNTATTTTLNVPAYDSTLYLGPPIRAVNLNQRGLTGTWTNSATNGQGFVIEVAPDFYSKGIGLLFGGWYTYDSTAAGGQRWYTLQGQVSGDRASATIPIYLTQGGVFNAAASTTTTAVGQSTLTFTDCNHGVLSYTFTDGSGNSGTIPLTRFLPDDTCR